MPVSESITASALWTSFSILSIRFDNRRMLPLGHPFALVADAFSILILAVLDCVLLADSPSLFNLSLHVVGWFTLGSGCLSSVLLGVLSGLLSLLPMCFVQFTLGTG